MAISIEDFKKIDLRIGKIFSAERVEGSEKLVKLSVDIGEETPRQLVAGIGKAYILEDLIGKTIVVVANLEPRELMGLTSQGMLLAASDEDGLPVLLTIGKGIAPGAKIM